MATFLQPGANALEVADLDDPDRFEEAFESRSTLFARVGFRFGFPTLIDCRRSCSRMNGGRSPKLGRAMPMPYTARRFVFSSNA